MLIKFVLIKPKADVIFILKFSFSKLVLSPYNGKGTVQFSSKKDTERQ